MIRMSSLLDPENVLLDLEPGSKEDALRALCDALARSGRAADADSLLRDVLEREAIAPTGLGYGCAVPHAHSRAMFRTSIAAARLGEPIDFGAPDGDRARLVFLLAGPPGAEGLHLQVLSKLARLLHDPRVRAGMLDSPDAATFLSFLGGDDR